MQSAFPLPNQSPRPTLDAKVINCNEEDNSSCFIMVRLMAGVACAAFTIFSTFSSACDYYTVFRRPDVAFSRVLGLQASIVVFWALAALLCLTISGRSAIGKAGCVLGVLLCVAVGSVQTLDSALTSFGYQDYRLGSLTATDRSAAAKIDSHEEQLSQLMSRHTLEVVNFQSAIDGAKAELAVLDGVLAPAIASGKTLKASYSINRVQLTDKIQELGRDKSLLLHNQLTEIQDMHSEKIKAVESIKASNSSGTSRASALLGITPELMIAGKTASTELCLVALALMMGFTAWFTMKSEGSVKNKNMALLLGQLAMVSLTFFVAYGMFIKEVPFIEKDLSGGINATSPANNDEVEIDYYEEMGRLDDAVFGEVDSSLFDESLFYKAFNESQGERPEIILYD
tara:strand:+ start:2502 stop:3698 length:1197 start_codon:yes stop_codon:yes gene_type:complete